MKKPRLIIRLYLIPFIAIFACFFCENVTAQGIERGLIINEFSNGTSGSREYMEFLVIGCPGEKIDIRLWLFDDNSGYFSPTTSQGIATGHMRFTNDPQWEEVPVGAIILVYNNADKNPEITIADDPSDANDDSVYVLSPSNSSLIDGCSGTPTSGSDSYTCGSAYAPVGWTVVGLNNNGDAAQVRKPDGTFFHGIAYRDLTNVADGVVNGGPDGILFEGNRWPDLASTAGYGTARVFSYSSCYFRDIATFVAEDARITGTQTPGRPNNDVNQAYIDYLRRGELGGVLSPVSQNLSCSQDPAQLSESGVTFRCDEPFQWQSSPTGAIGSFVDISGAIEETYTPTVGNGTTYFRRMVSGTCGIDSSNNVSVTLTPVPGDVTVAAPKDTCAGPVTLTASGGTSGGYAWFDGPTDGDLIAGENNATLSTIITQSGSYYVALRDGNCIGDKEEYPITITQVTVNAGPDLALNTGQQIDLQATSNGTQFTWSPVQGLSEATILNPVLTAVREGYYVLEATNGATCAAKDSFLVSFKDACQLIGVPNLITPNNDGKNDAFDVGCYISYDWFFEVYNKWGKRVYLADPMTGPWSPDLSPDVYYFYLEDRASGQKFNSWLQIVE
jgi:hypothetical protein